jgi:hypothetical protein
MFKTNLKIAWRNLIKDKQFTFLNVLGLSAGLACALLIFLWLQGFAYRISLTPYVFVIAGISVILVTLFTISFQSIKAAMSNPVKSLRTE